LLLGFTVLAVGCSSKKNDPAPPAPPVALTGRWDLTKQVITEHNPDGSVLSATTYDTYQSAGQLWSYVFKADNTFEYFYQGQISRKGTYVRTPTSVVQTNTQGSTMPTTTYLIDNVTDTELVLRSPAIVAGKTGVSTWVKRL
jgi:hypothetical protein